MGHEMAHQLLRHADKMRRIYKKFVAFRALDALLSNWNFSRSLDSLRTVLFLIRYLRQQSSLEYFRKKRAHEFQADREGALIMLKAMYSWSGCMKHVKTAIKKKKLQKRSEPDEKPEFHTHPTVRQFPILSTL